ncbi:hypothetical protein ACEYW6_25760 [Nostoc sp. UIC 10607]|uniref:hypothetical protein n=1 Tax=Nostoc sp. UIC 10607 TaxID=3045935 RepID=UPI0039A2C1A8
MKVNEWINQKFWQSIIIRFAPSVEYVGGIRLQHKRCLRGATPTHTAKFSPEKICGKGLNLAYVCIDYDLDIAIALKVLLKHNWLIQKISAIHSSAKPKLIVPITKKKDWFVLEYNALNQLSVLYSHNVGRCHNTVAILQAA